MSSSNGNLPLVMHFHGGTWKAGAAGEFQNYVLEHNVAIMSVQYRLGLFERGLI